jgi:hypothetical protein
LSPSRELDNGGLLIDFDIFIEIAFIIYASFLLPHKKETSAPVFLKSGCTGKSEVRHSIGKVQRTMECHV